MKRVVTFLLLGKETAMKQKRKLTVCLICGILLCTVTVLLFVFVPKMRTPVRDVDYYEYPITPSSSDWDKFGVTEKVDMLIIPDDILTRMTDEALVTAIAEYPYLADLHMYGTGLADGVETMRKYFSALDELFSRDTAVEAMQTYGPPIVERLTNAAAETPEEARHNYVTAGLMSELIDYFNAPQSHAPKSHPRKHVTASGGLADCVRYRIR